MAAPVLPSMPSAGAAAPAGPSAPPNATPSGPAPAGPLRPFQTASLYVGDLSPEVAEPQLYDIFSSVGQVATIRVCRDVMTRRSLGYAYVNYHNPADAERALDTLNYSLIRGKACRIAWAHRDPSRRKSGSGNIFIKNLHPSIDNKILHDTFSIYGSIQSAKVQTNAEGQSLGYGYVAFDTPEDAERAIREANGSSIQGQVVQVEAFKPRSERASQDKSKFTNVYARNFPKEMSEPAIRELFTPFGEVTSFFFDAEKRFACVNYRDSEAAAASIAQLNDKDAQGSKLMVTRCQKKKERIRESRERFEKIRGEQQKQGAGSNVYIKNLGESIDDDALKQQFGKFGNITSAKVMRDERGQSRGFGFVCFSNSDEANKAIMEMNGKMLFGKPLYCTLHQRKEVRKAQIEAFLRSRNPVSGMQMGPGGMGMAASMSTGMGLQPPPMYFNPQLQMMPQVQGVAGVPNMNMSMMGMRMLPQQMMRPGPRGWQAGPGAMPLNMGRGMPVARQPFGQQQMQGMGAPLGAPFNNYPRGGGRGRGAGLPGARSSYRARPEGPVSPQAMGPEPVELPPAPIPVPPPAPAPAKPAPVLPGPDPTAAITLEHLAAAPPDQQKQMLGERLYPLVYAKQSELAGKITGMLLEMDNGELVHLLESSDALNEKLNEALAVLQEAAQST